MFRNGKCFVWERHSLLFDDLVRNIVGMGRLSLCRFEMVQAMRRRQWLVRRLDFAEILVRLLQRYDMWAMSYYLNMPMLHCLFDRLYFRSTMEVSGDEMESPHLMRKRWWKGFYARRDGGLVVRVRVGVDILLR